MSSTPKRKRMKRKERLKVAKKWIKEYNGKNLVRGYRKWFGVDFICSIKELEMLGHKIDSKYKKQIIEQEKSKQKKAEEKRKKRKENEAKMEHTDSDENFYFIAGYTSGGFPYGITWEQHENEKKTSDKDIDVKESPIDSDEIPF